jgi:hypothetical protein
VWSDAPNGGKWVVPDERQEGEAHAIYLDKHGRVDKNLSSREYQQSWLSGKRAQVEASTPAAGKARREREQKLKDIAEKTRSVSRGSRPFKDLSEDDLNTLRARYSHYAVEEGAGYGRSQRTTLDKVVSRELDLRKEEAKVAEYRKTALKDVSPTDRAAYEAAYKRNIADGDSPEQAHRDALRDMVGGRSLRKVGLSSTPGGAVELAQVIHQIRKAKAAA